MNIGLGIDTGGTYTDAILYDYNTKEIISSVKTPTIKNDLKKSITEAIWHFSEHYRERIDFVSLSTTLATNAAVENKGCQATLVLIGPSPEIIKGIIDEKGAEFGLQNAVNIIYLKGGHDCLGNIIMTPDWSKFKKKLQKSIRSTDSFAVAQIWGIRNPEFELIAKDIIIRETGMTCVCAHKLTTKLNFLKRASTALLNAKLVNINREFIKSVKESLHNMNISAPISIVKSDGTLMTEKIALENPVFTLASGPASSIAGAITLTNERDCIVIDMGGTTSDLALVQDCQAGTCEEGLVIGNYRPYIPSIKMRTVGIGGDSRISFDINENIIIGPERILPFSRLAEEYPEVITQAKKILNARKKKTYPLCEFLILNKNCKNVKFSEKEKIIINLLRNGPKSIEQLSVKLKTFISKLDIRNLIDKDIIMKSGLTPTDIMHIKGDFNEFNTEAASICSEIMAERLNLSGVKELCNVVYNFIKSRLFYKIVKMMSDDKISLDRPEVRNLILMSYFNNNPLFNINIKSNISLVGVGAPIHVFLDDVASALNCKVVTPPFAEVANATGAITGIMREDFFITIKPNEIEEGEYTGFVCLSLKGRNVFKKYEEALNWSIKTCEKVAEIKVLESGGTSIRLSSNYRETFASPKGLKNKEEIRNYPFIETVVEAVAIGRIST